MKEILVLKSPYTNLGGRIRNLFEKSQENKIMLVGIQYTGLINFKNKKGVTFNRYDPKDFSIEPLYVIRRNKKEEVTNMRLKDIFQNIQFSGYMFEKGLGLKLVKDPYGYELFEDTKIINQETIEKIATLIYKRVEGILPLWTQSRKNVIITRARENNLEFFQKIAQHKKMPIKKESDEETDPVQFMNNF